MDNKMIIIIIIIKIISSARLEKSENTINPKTQPHPTNPWMEEKEKIVWDKNKERIRQQEALALLLKPSCPSPSNTGQPRSFHRAAERGTKVLPYWEFLQQGGANECLWATKAPRVTRSVGSPIRGCIGLLLILNSMHNTAADRR